MSTPSDQLDNQALVMSKVLAKMSETARDIAQENLGETCANVPEPCAPERDKIHGVNCACEQYVSARPQRSVLMATGLGCCPVALGSTGEWK